MTSRRIKLVASVSVIAFILGLVSWLVLSTEHKSSVQITVISGAGGIPPDSSPGEILKHERFEVVFTEPFVSLYDWQSSKVINSVAFENGQANINLPPGKYGIYYIYQGNKVLYDDLELENPRNDIERGKQGPWFVQIRKIGKTELRFSVNSQPV